MKYDGRKNEHRQEVHLGTVVVHRRELNLSLHFYTYDKMAVRFFEVIEDHDTSEPTIPYSAIALRDSAPEIFELIAFDSTAFFFNHH